MMSNFLFLLSSVFFTSVPCSFYLKVLKLLSTKDLGFLCIFIG